MADRGVETSAARPVVIRPGQARQLARDLSRAWDEFQASGTVLPTVRPLIAASWRRARGLGVSPRLRNSQVDTGYQRLLRSQTRQLLLGAAEPVITRLVGLTDGTPLTLTLADADGVILLQHGDRAMLKRGERFGMVPGSRWSELDAGTNGMGTALFVGHTTQVFAGEHYCEGFHPLVCTAGPVRHPLTGQIVGVFDITMQFSEGTQGVWALVTQTADAIESAIRERLTASDRLLLEALTSTGAASAAFAVDLDGRHTIGNRRATSSLGPDDHAVLRSVVRQTLASGDLEPVPYELPGGRRVLVHVRPVTLESEPIGAVVALQDQRPPETAARSMAHDTEQGWFPFSASAGWLGAAEVASRSTDPVLVVGEPGAGKSTMVDTLHRRRHGGRLVLIDCPTVDLSTWNAAWEGCAAEPGSGVLLRHVDELVPRLQSRLVARLERAAPGPAIFATASTVSREALRAGRRLREDLVDRIAVHVVWLPPLRERPDEFDLILRRVLMDLNLTWPSISVEALSRLRSYAWPGNVRQLRNVLQQAATHLLNGPIEVRSLPPEIVANTSARRLSRIEQLQMDAILDALQTNGGNVSRAAEHLGISRATVYRWLHANNVRGMGVDGVT